MSSEKFNLTNQILHLVLNETMIKELCLLKTSPAGHGEGLMGNINEFSLQPLGSDPCWYVISLPRTTYWGRVFSDSCPSPATQLLAVRS